MELERRPPGTHVCGGGPGRGEARGKRDRQLWGGGVRGGAGEMLNHSPEVGGVGLDEGGIIV